MDRQGLFRAHPFLLPGRCDFHVVCGDDLDSLLSTALYLKYQPRARIAGFYAGFRELLLVPGVEKELGKSVWMDLDIAHPACPSLGHHILATKANEPLLRNPFSLNLNAERGVSLAQFERKYPLGTIHFLCALYEEPIPEKSAVEPLVWLADSAFINGQSHRFRENTGSWVADFLGHEGLLRGFERLDEVSFEDGIASVMEALKKEELRPGRTQTRSFHRALPGFSVKVQPRDVASFMALSRFITRATGWPYLPDRLLGGGTIGQRGTRRRESVRTVLGGRGLAEFLRDESVFSYVFPGMGEMNYTVGIDPQKSATGA